MCEDIAQNFYIRQGSNTLWRYDYLQKNVNINNSQSKEEVFLALKNVAIPHDSSSTHATATCSSISMDIKDNTMIACKGISENKDLKEYTYIIKD